MQLFYNAFIGTADQLEVPKCGRAPRIRESERSGRSARYDRHDSKRLRPAAKRLDKRLVTRKCKRAKILELRVDRVQARALAKLHKKDARRATDRRPNCHLVDAGAFNSFALKCNEAGLDIFRTHVPRRQLLLSMAAVHWILKLYRGKLVGFIVVGIPKMVSQNRRSATKITPPPRFFSENKIIYFKNN